MMNGTSWLHCKRKVEDFPDQWAASFDAMIFGSTVKINYVQWIYMEANVAKSFNVEFKQSCPGEWNESVIVLDQGWK